MPSRFSFYSSREEVEKAFQSLNLSSEDINEFHPYYNLKPTNRATGIINEFIDNKSVYKAVRMRWGFIKGTQFYKVRSETINEKKLFSKAFKERRCVILANGFFEWEKEDRKRIPYYFTVRSQPLFGIAGVYNSYTDEEDDNKLKYRFAVATVDANKLVAKIFHRMPVIFHLNTIEKWLDPLQDQKSLLEMLKPYPSEDMNSWKVKSLPSKGDNGPSTIKPLKKGGLANFM